MHTPDVGSGALLATGPPEAPAPLSVRGVPWTSDISKLKMYRFIKILNIFMNPYIYLHTFNFKNEIFTFKIKFGIEITNFLYQDLYNVSQKSSRLSLSNKSRIKALHNAEQ